MKPSTRLHGNHIQEILHTYGLDLIAYEPITAGYSSPSYWVNTQEGQFVLTFFEIGMQRAKYQANVLQHLKKYDFPAPRVKKTASGALLTTYRGEPILMKPFIRGQTLEVLTRPMLKQVGTAMARLHKIPLPDASPRQHAYGLQTFPSLIEHQIDPVYETWLARRYAFLRKQISSSLPRGLIHGDIFKDNLLFAGEKLKALIDFEEACWYYLVFDLGMAIVGSCSNGEHMNLEKARGVLAGYQQIRALEPEEKHSLQIFIEYAAVATSSWRYWRNNIDKPDEEKTDRHWIMANLANHVNSIPRETFHNIFC